MSGYFEIGIFHGKHKQNIGTLWRSAYTFGAAGIFTVGRRYKKQSSDTLKTWGKIPLRHYLTYDDFLSHVPFGARLVCVEMAEGATALPEFVHPRTAIYLLGAEDHGLPARIMAGRRKLVIPTLNTFCLNVAVAGSIVMWDRYVKGLSDD